MKQIFALLITVAISISAVADRYTETITAENPEQMQMMHLLLGVKKIYHSPSNVDLNVVTFLGGDGLNASRLLLSVMDVNNESQQAFILNTQFRYMKRVSFKANDEIQIVVIQDSFKDEGQTAIEIKKTIIIKLQRDREGNITNQLVYEELS